MRRRRRGSSHAAPRPPLRVLVVQRRLASAGEWRGAHPRHRRRGLAPRRRRGGGDRARPLPHRAAADLSRDPPGAAAAAAARPAGRCVRARMRCTSPPKARSAGPCARSAGAAAGPSPPASTPASRTTCTPARACRGASPGRCCGASTTAGQGIFAATASLRAELAAQRLRADPALGARRRPRAVPRRIPPRSDAVAGPAAAGLPLCRARRGGEEHRGLPRPRPAGHQGGGGRRAAARRAAAALPGGAFRRLARGQGAGARPMPGPMSWSFPPAPTPSAWCCWRRWPAARRWRPSRSPARATSSPPGDRRAGRGSARRGAGGAGRRPGPLPRACRGLRLGRLRRRLPPRAGADRPDLCRCSRDVVRSSYS